jgi:dienelactone hydrolase
MPTISQSELTFQSGSKPIRLDAYLPETPSAPGPAVIALYGAGGNVSGMERYAGTLAAQGFAVYILHYFDSTGAIFRCG